MSMLNANLRLLLLFHPVTTTALLRPVSAIGQGRRDRVLVARAVFCAAPTVRRRVSEA